jgi:hypothetical protein
MERIAFFLAGYEKLPPSRAKWYPWGKIRAYDNVVDDVIPLEGVKVRARNWYSWKHDYTDANGNYYLG